MFLTFDAGKHLLEDIRTYSEDRHFKRVCENKLFDDDSLQMKMMRIRFWRIINSIRLFLVQFVVNFGEIPSRNIHFKGQFRWTDGKNSKIRKNTQKYHQFLSNRYEPRLKTDESEA